MNRLLSDEGVPGMRAMVPEKIDLLEDNPPPVVGRDLPEPVPGEGKLLVEAEVCGVCHIGPDEIEGRTPPRVLPVIPGDFRPSGGGAPARLTSGKRFYRLLRDGTREGRSPLIGI